MQGFLASFETSSAVIDVFAGRQWRDRSIGEEVKVEPRGISRECCGQDASSKVFFLLSRICPVDHIFPLSSHR